MSMTHLRYNVPYQLGFDTLGSIPSSPQNVTG